MTPHSTEISVAARFSALPCLLDWLAQQAAASGFAVTQGQRMQLVVEELFANTLHHGHRGECDAQVCIAWRASERGVTLSYSDSAPPFDLLAAAPSPPSSAPERLGGAGLKLVRALSSAVRYRRVDERNVTELDFCR